VEHVDGLALTAWSVSSCLVRAAAVSCSTTSGAMETRDDEV
jgi:hypothetical protein